MMTRRGKGSCAAEKGDGTCNGARCRKKTGSKPEALGLKFILIILVSLPPDCCLHVGRVRQGRRGWLEKSGAVLQHVHPDADLGTNLGVVAYSPFIPLVGAVFYLMAMLALAERFGKGVLFGMGLTFLPMFFFPLLAFGGAQIDEFQFSGA